MLGLQQKVGLHRPQEARAVSQVVNVIKLMYTFDLARQLNAFAIFLFSVSYTHYMGMECFRV